MQIYDFPQNSPEWEAIRLGIPTASALNKILAKGQGKTRKSFMLDLLGERLTQTPCENFSTRHTRRGHALEDQVGRIYTLETGRQIEKVGFMREGEFGASPDALVGEDGLMEAKTRLPRLQLELLMKGEVPLDHVRQIQGQLWVSGRAWCDYISWCPKVSVFIKRVERDETMICEIAKAVKEFIDELVELERRFRAMGGVY